MYNSISGGYWVIFVPNLAIQLLPFVHNLHANLTTTSHIFHFGCMAFTCSRHFNCQLNACLCSHLNGEWNGSKLQIDFWYPLMNLILIYCSCCYWKGALIRRNTSSSCWYTYTLNDLVLTGARPVDISFCSSL